jgi:4-amino-4-deoxy-L-arabinose transferase-like glycosyltransferase
VLLLVLVLTTVAVRRSWPSRRFAAIGLLVGYAVLVRSPGAVLVAAPMLVALGCRSSWRTGVRPTLALLVGVVAVLAPWTVRNGIEVGIWTPMSTNNVAFVCTGNGDGADGTFNDAEATSRRCYRGSVFDNPALHADGDQPTGMALSHPDERRWYATTARNTAGWMLRHPADQPRLVGNRLEATFRHEREALGDAEGFGAAPLMGPAWRRLLVSLGGVWLWSVMASAAVGLLFVRRCRRAVPIWGIVGLQVLMLAPGLGVERYHQPIVPLLVVLGAGVAVRLRRLAPEVEIPSGTAEAVDVAGPRRVQASAR